MSKGLPMSMDADMVRNIVREQMEALEMTQKAYAEMCGYSAQYLSDFLSGRRDPGLAILDGLGLKAVTYYEYKDETA